EVQNVWQEQFQDWNMIKHLEGKHPNAILDETAQQTDIFVFSQNTCRQAFLKWVVMTNQPFNAPEQHLNLTKCLEELGVLYSKILAITTDNASSNDTLFEWLNGYEIDALTSQVRCLAHVINLRAQDLVKSLKAPLDFDTDYENFLENKI
ncbi:hypothetical protein Bhyg_07511, partial [Pseudolycoriella hygida]